jgi:uncharacterized membrane protein YgcG
MVCVNKATCLLLAFLLAFLPSFAAYAETGYTPIPRYAQIEDTNQQATPQPYVDYQPSPAYERAMENIQRITEKSTRDAQALSAQSAQNAIYRTGDVNEQSPYYQYAQNNPAPGGGGADAPTPTYYTILPVMLKFVSDIITGLGDFAVMLFDFFGGMFGEAFKFLTDSSDTQTKTLLNGEHLQQTVSSAHAQALNLEKIVATAEVPLQVAENARVEDLKLKNGLMLDGLIKSGQMAQMCIQPSASIHLSGAHSNAEQARIVASRNWAKINAQISDVGLDEIDSDNPNNPSSSSGGSSGRGSPSGGGGGGTSPTNNPGDGKTPNDKEEGAMPGSKGPLAELGDRYPIALLFCSPTDMDSAADVFCPETCPSSGDKKCDILNAGLLAEYRKHNSNFKKDKSIQHLDTDFTNAIESRRSWGLGYHWYENEAHNEKDPKSSPYIFTQQRNEAIDRNIADTFMSHIFRSSVTPLKEDIIEQSIDPDTGIPDPDIIEFILDSEEKNALNSIAQAPFIKMIADKTPVHLVPGQETANTTLLNHASKILLGVEDANGAYTDEDLTAMPSDMGRNLQREIIGDKAANIAPSYDAQLEFLAKQIYMNPKFIMALGEEDFQAKQMMAAATKNIVTYDLMKSLQRQEILLATMVELLLQRKYEELEQKSGDLSGADR